jgi:hypothetical protein
VSEAVHEGVKPERLFVDVKSWVSDMLAELREAEPLREALPSAVKDDVLVSDGLVVLVPLRLPHTKVTQHTSRSGSSAIDGRPDPMW